MAAPDGTSAAKRRRERRLRAAWRHEQQSVAMALTAALHHSADRKMQMKMVKEQQNEAPRRQTTVTAQMQGDAKVARPSLHERVSEPMVEHIVVDVSVPQVVEDVLISVDVPTPRGRRRSGGQALPWRIMEHVVLEVPVPQMTEEIAEVFQFAAQEHNQARISEQSVDALCLR